MKCDLKVATVEFDASKRLIQVLRTSNPNPVREPERISKINSESGVISEKGGSAAILQAETKSTLNDFINIADCEANPPNTNIEKSKNGKLFNPNNPDHGEILLSEKIPRKSKEFQRWSTYMYAESIQRPPLKKCQDS
ncbi:hypothetical protein JTB14_010768 [Gonioctena quinquepunctata]|nr:hypothetical protein JTB14_010768 [Gonioctena quinquepunctata]